MNHILYLANCFYKLAQADQELDSPNVRIEPMEGLVQKAVERMKQADPNYFKGVRSIVLTSGAGYGFVESGPDKDPTVIHLNFERIKQEAGQDNEEGIIESIISTIAHEKGHITSFKPEQGFVGGEVPAEQEVHRFLSQIQH